MSAAIVHLYMQVLISSFLVSMGALLILMLADVDVGSALARLSAALQLRRVRMGAMLEARHIDRRLYLRMTPVFELRREIASCRNCPNQQLCDAELRCGEGSASGYSYCPNALFLNTLAARIRRQQSAGQAGA